MKESHSLSSHEGNQRTEAAALHSGHIWLKFNMVVGLKQMQKVHNESMKVKMNPFPLSYFNHNSCCFVLFF